MQSKELESFCVLYNREKMVVFFDVQQKSYMKVVISKSGLYVREPKNINLSRTSQDTKKSKLGFCRMSSGLSCHVKSLVNTC